MDNHTCLCYTVIIGVITIKTLIELFDESQIENVIAALNFMPEKVIFVGFDDVMTVDRTSALEKFFKLKGIDISLEYYVVKRDDYDDISDTLNNIVANNADCALDLTGGKELVLTAMGEVATNRDIPVFQFDINAGTIIKVKNCENIGVLPDVSMNISQCVTLNGGAVSYDDEGEVEWELSYDFKCDIETMWNISRKNSRAWNKQCLTFEDLQKFGEVTDGTFIRADLENIRKPYFNNVIIDKLINYGLIYDYKNNGHTVSFCCKNIQVKRCLFKAGNILELYTYMKLKEIEAKDPAFYNDIDVGVFVDWDGVFNAPDSDKKDTRNEIDIFVMRGIVPVFVSCKNGGVKKEALYELNTVAQKFGGEYAKRYLLCTYLSGDADSKEFIKQRAADMNIEIISGVHDLDKEGFIDMLKTRVI
ncbi:MAG: DUF1887 family protein [Clostridia bacterium]|nr:DUF1887 family protein [Clostridia bacterium]